MPIPSRYAPSTRNDAHLPRARAGLASEGLAALVIGVLLLTVIPNMMRGQLSPTIAQVLRPAGWVALSVGYELGGGFCCSLPKRTHIGYDETQYGH